MNAQEAKRVEEIRSMEATTPDGHWYAKQHNENYGQGYGATTYFVDVGPEIIKIGMGENSNDCTKYYAFSRFIAAARSDIPFLLDIVKRQEEEIGRLPCNGCKWSGMIRPQKCATCCRNKHMKDNYQEATP